MEIVCKVCFGLLVLMVLCLIAGFVSTWWEWRKQQKKTKGDS